MTYESPNFISEWVRDPKTSDMFRRAFEVSRGVGYAPLTTAFKAIGKDTSIYSDDILSLGHGTGQVEEMMGLDSSRLTGIEINPSYIESARKRLPQARFIQGRIEEELDSVDYTPTTFTAEALDCIDPTVLPSVLSKLRTKTDRLIAVQTYSPDPEFYNSAWPNKGLSIGGPGIESWKPDQLDFVTGVLNEHNVNATSEQPNLLLSQVQRYVEEVLDGSFSVGIVEALRRIKVEPVGFQADLPFPAQVSVLLNRTELRLENFVKLFRSSVANTPESIAVFLPIDTTHRYLQLLRGVFGIECYLNLLQKSCEDSGFENVERKAANAVENSLVSDKELVRRVNTSLSAIKSPPHRQIKDGDAINNAFIGSPLQFLEPLNNSYTLARVPYLVAS